MRFRNGCYSATIATSATKEPKVRAADRELGQRLGALILSCMSSDGGGAVRAMDESGLAFSQMKVVMTIASQAEGEVPSVKSVSDRLGLSLASTSRAVDSLVRKGLVARTEDAHDRRVRRLALTPTGDELSDRILTARLEGLARFAASLSGAERGALAKALDLLLEREEIAEVLRRYAR